MRSRLARSPVIQRIGSVEQVELSSFKLGSRIVLSNAPASKRDLQRVQVLDVVALVLDHRAQLVGGRSLDQALTDGDTRAR
jgi:hypothetical protein